MASKRFVSPRIVARLALIALAGAVVLSGSRPVSSAGGRVIERVGSVSAYTGMAISADGRFVAFHGSVVDRKTGTAQPVPTGAYGQVDMSADGRYVAFASGAALVPQDDNGRQDVYMFDRVLGSYELISVAADGSRGNHFSGFFDDITVSGDGRFVAFVSQASNLVPDDTSTCFQDLSCLDVFVRDRLLGLTERVSVASDGTEGNAHSGEIGVDMSADGRFVAFDSYATNLVPDGGGGVYVRDRDTDEDGVYDEPGAVETVFVGVGVWPTISDDGRFVAYHGGVLLHDRESGTTTTVAETGFGGGGTAMDLSSDGRYLSFATDLPLVPEDTNGFTDVYLYDRLTDTMELLSVAQDGSLANDHSAWGFPLEHLAVIALTPDARYAAFHSWATNLVPGEGPGVFVARSSLFAEVDTDGDGCTDKRELGPDASRGGQRDPQDFWDFFDTPDAANVRDKGVTIGDLFAVASRFGASGDPASDPLAGPIPAPPAYHTAFDRGGKVGANIWNQAPADGAIAVGDIFAVAGQFGHNCA